MKSIVAKFGGSSVKDKTAMFRCVEIIQKNPDIKVVVVSATYSTTNQLQDMCFKAADHKLSDAKNVLKIIKERHLGLAAEINLSTTQIDKLCMIMNECDPLIEGIALLKECSPRAMDRLFSIGERMSSILFEGLFKQHATNKKIHLVDATNFIKTDGNHLNARPDIVSIKHKCEELIIPLIEKPDHIVLTQGFIGTTKDDVITTLGREGSDYTAALIADAINATELQIWTDVDGVYSTDPKLINTAKKIKTTSYEEASYMASVGAKVLFSRTLDPVQEKNIPVFVGSTLRPELGGTYISGHDYCNTKALVLNSKKIMIMINVPDKNLHPTVLEILHHHDIQFDFFEVNGEDLSLSCAPLSRFNNIVLEKLGEIGNLKVKESIESLTLVGNIEPSLIQKHLAKISFFKLIKNTKNPSLTIYSDTPFDPKVLKAIHDDLILD